MEPVLLLVIQLRFAPSRTRSQAGRNRHHCSLARYVIHSEYRQKHTLCSCPKQVKTNLGHSEAASGISSIIKAVLALERGVIPPTVDVGTMNPDIKAYDWNVEIVTRNTPWPCDGWNIPRRAGIVSGQF